MVRAASIGDHCVDVYTGDHQALFPGGNAVNVAVFLRRHGIDCMYFGTLGNDRLGRIVLESLANEGVDTSLCRILSGRSGATMVEVRGGERVFLSNDLGVQDRFECDAPVLQRLRQFDIVHYSGFTSWYFKDELEAGRFLEKNIETLRRLRSASLPVSFDFSEIQDPDYIAEVARYISIGFISLPCRDAHMAREFLHTVARNFDRRATVVVTLGANGSASLVDGEDYFQEAPKVDPVDTLGCGDAYIAAYIAAYLEHMDPQTCLQRATISAAETLQHVGAWGHAYREEEVEEAEVENESSGVLRHRVVLHARQEQGCQLDAMPSRSGRCSGRDERREKQERDNV